MFTANACLQELDVRVPVPSPPSLDWALCVLLRLFSNIVSRRLQDVHLIFELPMACFEAAMPSTTFIYAIHAALHRRVFASLEEQTVQDDDDEAPVQVAFRYGSQVVALPNEQARLSDAMRPIVICIFRPWLISGIIQIELPDGTYVDDDNV